MRFGIARSLAKRQRDNIVAGVVEYRGCRPTPKGSGLDNTIEQPRGPLSTHIARRLRDDRRTRTKRRGRGQIVNSGDHQRPQDNTSRARRPRASRPSLGALLEIPCNTKENGRDYQLSLAASNACRALLPAQAGLRILDV